VPIPITLNSFIRRLDLSTLDLFVSICATGSIAAAAARGQMAVSSLSKRVSLLEETAGSPLFERHARGVRPTLAGEALLRHARSLLAGVSLLHEDLRAFSQGSLGSVHIAANASAVELYLPDEIARFASEYPDVSIDLTQRASNEVLQVVRDGQVDFGLCGVHEGLEHELERRPYRMDPLVLLVPLDHPLARHSETEFDRALEHEQIGLLGSSQVQGLLEAAADRSGRRLRQRIRVASIGALCRMVESGLGIAVMPRGMVRLAARRSRSRVVGLTDEWAQLQLYVYSRRFDQLSTPARLLLGHLLESRPISGRGART
jgi:DNA-binding transcriptional LysR family regulator